MRQSMVALGRISAFLARAVHIWKYGALFPPGFVRKMNYPTILWLFAQCLARQLMHVLHQYETLLDEIHTFSTLTWT